MCIVTKRFNKKGQVEIDSSLTTNGNKDVHYNDKTNEKTATTYTTTDISPVNYRLWGNVFHTLNILNVIAYATLIMTFGNHNHPKSREWFDEEWLKHGFCVSNIDIPYWSSHDLCLYGDTVMAILVAIIYFKLCSTTSKSKAMEQANDMMKWQAFSVFGHGLAHGSMASTLRSMSSDDFINQQGASQYEMLQDIFERRATTHEETLKLVGQTIFMAFCFWFPLIRSAVPRQMSHLKVLGMSMLVVLGGMNIPKQHGFTYVQTVITAIFGYSELIGKSFSDKNTFSYMVFAFVGIPISIVPWFEAMACQSSGYIEWGGHALYDVSIPMWLIVAYVSCYFNSHFSANMKEKVESKVL